VGQKKPVLRMGQNKGGKKRKRTPMAKTCRARWTRGGGEKRKKASIETATKLFGNSCGNYVRRLWLQEKRKRETVRFGPGSGFFKNSHPRLSGTKDGEKKKVRRQANPPRRNTETGITKN